MTNKPIKMCFTTKFIPGLWIVLTMSVLNFMCQSQWKCCGVIAYTDWHDALREKVVPDRCCQEHYQNCGRNSTNMFWNRVSSQWRKGKPALLYNNINYMFVHFSKRFNTFLNKWITYRVIHLNYISVRLFSGEGKPTLLYEQNMLSVLVWAPFAWNNGTMPDGIDEVFGKHRLL